MSSYWILNPRTKDAREGGRVTYLHPVSLALTAAYTRKTHKHTHTHKLCAPTHALNHLLPPTRNRASLRTRGHSYQLPEYSTDLYKKSFLIRSLYSFVRWNSFFLVLLLCTVRHSDCFLCLFFSAFVASNKYYIHTYCTNIHIYIHTYYVYPRWRLSSQSFV